MTRIEWFAAAAVVAIVVMLGWQASRIDPLAAGTFIFQEHGWDDFHVCRRIGAELTCRTVGDIFR